MEFHQILLKGKKIVKMRLILELQTILSVLNQHYQKIRISISLYHQNH